MIPYQYFQYQNINKTLLNYLTLRKNTLYLYHKSIDRIYHEDNNLGMFCLFLFRLQLRLSKDCFIFKF